MRHTLLTTLVLSLLLVGDVGAEPKRKEPHRWRNPSKSVHEVSESMVLSGLVFGPISAIALPLFAVSAVVAVGDSVRVVVVDSVGTVVGVLDVPKERARRAALKPGDPVQVTADPPGHTVSANGVMLTYVPGEASRDLIHREPYSPR